MEHTSHTIKIGELTVGGGNEPVLQSMVNIPLLEIEKCVEQAIDLHNAGCQLLRFSTINNREVALIKNIRNRIIEKGISMPIIADVHYNSNIAQNLVGEVEKIRINPGNYLDSSTKSTSTITNDAYLKLLNEKLTSFVQKCSESNTAIRIGVNHGSLSNRILEKFGNTPQGMVESAMEYARVCHQLNFKNVIISLKSSDVNAMIESNLLLRDVMFKEGLTYPIHLGITEAGNGIQARVKSIYAIQFLLSIGIGDTFRVSLTENPIEEISLAKKMLNSPSLIRHDYKSIGNNPIPFLYIMGNHLDRLKEYYSIHHNDDSLSFNHHYKNPSFDLGQKIQLYSKNEEPVKNEHKEGVVNVLVLEHNEESEDEFIIHCVARAIPMLKSGVIRGVVVNSSSLKDKFCDELTMQILQVSSGIELRPTYISCPGCSRTLFELEEVTKLIQQKTVNLPPLRIGIMGCVINGPGEMRETDYGYVGSGIGKVDLYKKDKKIKKNIPQERAVDELLSLIHQNESTNG